MNTLTDFEYLKHELRANDFKHDPWGTSLIMQFDIAEELQLSRCIDVPSHWEYCSGMQSEPESNKYVDFTPKSLVQMGNLLHRMVRACETAGKNY